MKTHVRQDDGDWEVWITLDGQDPITDAFGFCIGSGSTRDLAIAVAVAELESATDELQQPAEYGNVFRGMARVTVWGRTATVPSAVASLPVN